MAILRVPKANFLFNFKMVREVGLEPTSGKAADFDSAIRRFESSRPSQPVQSPGGFVTMPLKSAPLAGFLRRAESLCLPNSMTPRPNMPKISAYRRHCSRFLEN